MPRYTYGLFSTLVIFTITIGLHAEGPKKLVLQKPTLTLSGTQSKIDETRSLRITDNAEFETIWKEHHLGKNAKTTSSDAFQSLDLDFQKFMVIALFSKSNHGSEYLPPEILENENQVTLRIASNSNQTGPGIGVPDRQPWAFFVISRTNKEIVLEHNAQRLLAEKPIWKPYKTFPKLKDTN